MLHVVAFLTALSVIFSGLLVLAKGDWQGFALKFAGVCLSTTAAIYMLTATIVFSGFNFCASDTPADLCMTFEIYYITRNVAFIIFHIAIGRDAIHFKQRDRRGTLCQKNSLKQSHP